MTKPCSFTVLCKAAEIRKLNSTLKISFNMIFALSKRNLSLYDLSTMVVLSEAVAVFVIARVRNTMEMHINSIH